MNETTEHPQIADSGRDPISRTGLAGILRGITARVRWMMSAAAALMTSAVLIAEGAAEPIAHAVACVGNGPIMALAAMTNAFTTIH